MDQGIEMFTSTISVGASHTFEFSWIAASVLLITDKNVTVAWEADSVTAVAHPCVYLAGEKPVIDSPIGKVTVRNDDAQASAYVRVQAIKGRRRSS